MKSVFQKLFQAKARLEDAWASTHLEQPDTLILRHGNDDDLCETVPMELMANATQS